MLVLSSPSGAGKTSISRHLLELDENLEMSVSATTRPRRPGEVNGRDYFFVDVTVFREMVDGRQLLEHAKVFDHYYGSPRGPIEDALAIGRDILFDIDWQGTQQLAEMARSDLVTVFILPPSTSELDRRLRARALDSEDVVASRMAKAMDEISHYPEYDYIIVNDDLDQSIANVQSILTSERLRRERQLGLTDFVKGLRQGQ
ncbi:MAG: guanylate kinase [Rhodospirillaceae bacterium]|nr:guanylate kinase [Rhodospirillaceae bacterium]